MIILWASLAMHPRGHPACPMVFFDDFDAKVQDARRHVSCHELMTSVMAKESTYSVLEIREGLDGCCRNRLNALCYAT